MNKTFKILFAALVIHSAVFAQEAVVDTAKATAPVDTTKNAVAENPADTAVSEKQIDDSAVAKVDAPVDTTKTAEPVAPAADTIAVTGQDTSAVQTVQVAPVPTEPVSTIYTEPSAEPVVHVSPSTKNWYHLVGLGITVPVSQYKINHKKIDFVNYGLNLTYLGMASNGLSIKLGVSAGGSVTDNIKFEDSDDWQIGTFTSYEAGIGYTFGCPQEVSFSIIAIIGSETVEFESEERKFKHEKLGVVDRTFTESMAALTLGGDMLLRIALGNHAGIFASVGGRWIPATASVSSVKYVDDDFTQMESYNDDGRGIYSVVPTIGAMWSF